MANNDVVLEKLPSEILKNDPHRSLGRRMLNSARKQVVLHLLNGGSAISGFLITSDIELIERKTRKRVKETTESGEFFYELI